jgi:two-component system, NarL family, sensor histidine kinase UhpB
MAPHCPTFAGAMHPAQSSAMPPTRVAPSSAGARWSRAVWLALLLSGVTASAGAAVLVFRDALAGIADAGLPPIAAPVELPDDWSHSRPGYSGIVPYRLGFDATNVAESGELYGLYVDRACSTLQVLVNDQLVHFGGSMSEPVSIHCQQPQLVPIPAALLRAVGNVVELRVRGFALEEVGSRQRAGGLSTVMLGPYAELSARHAQHLVFAIRLPEIMSGTLLLMGSFMFVMGWFNRRQSYLAYFGALMVGTAVTLSRHWLSNLPWSNHAGELLLATLAGFITLASVQFLMRYAGRRVHWLNLALPAQCLLIPLSLVAAGPRRLFMLSSIWSVLLALQVATAALVYLRAAFRTHSRQAWPMAAMLGAVALSQGLTFIAEQAQLDSRIASLAQLVPPLLFMVLGLRLVQQYGRAFQSAEQGRAELEVRIREATAQIERNFAQLSELKVEQVTERERKRIAADLHDDLGAKLLTIVHTSESERISTLAREALEEMRLSVRGLTGKPVRLVDALGDWRAEVISRLTQSGVEGEWVSPHDEDLPLTLSARAYVQTTRILREAVSNIIKHSGASTCSVRCTIAEGDFQLVIQDNGNGIPIALDGRLDKGHGMASMKGRAKQLQGQCLVESGPGYGTVIRLTLPLDRHATPS